MKRLIIFILIISLVISLFSIDIEKAKEKFLYYIENFDSSNTNDEFLLNIRDSIKNYLPIYRYYKIELVGSVEKTDVSKKIGDHLNVIYKQNISNDFNEQLARAAFFSYLEANLERKKFESSYIKSSTNFNTFFNSYQSKVIFAVRNYIADLFAKHLGANIDLPYDIDAPYYSFNFDYTPRFNNKDFLNEIENILKDSEIQKNFSTYLELIKKNPQKITLGINRYSGLLQRNIIKKVSSLKNEFADFFAKAAPKKVNFWWVRWIIYIVLATLLIKHKKWNLLILLVSISEIVYLFFGFDILSNTDATIYGLLVFFSLITAIGISLKNKKIFENIILGILVLSFFIPSFYTSELHMSNIPEFESSAYFNELADDVLKDKYSKFSNITRDLTTIVNSSIIETEGIIKRLSINLNNFNQKIKEPEYKNVNNFDNRISDFKKLSLEFENYQIEENIRKKQFKRAENKLENFAKNLASLSSQRFEEEFLKELNYKLNFEEVKPTLEKIRQITSNTKDKVNMPIAFYKTKFGIITFILFGIGILLYSLKNKISIVWFIAATISSILMLINPITFIVQHGVPTLSISYNICIPILTIISILMVIKSSLTLKG